MLLAGLLAGFQSLPPLPTSKLGPFWCQFLGGWACVHFRTLWVSPTNHPVWLGISPTSATPTVFTARDFETLVPCTGILGYVVCLTPKLFLPAYLHSNVRPTNPPVATSPGQVCRFAGYLLFPGCLCLLLLPVWMNVSSLTPWLSDFHTFQFPGSCGQFWLLNWLLSFFWLCKETKCIYLRLHLAPYSESNLMFHILSCCGILATCSISEFLFSLYIT